MPFYKTINARTPEGKRTAEGLLRLKTELDKAIPPKTVDPTLLLATWNLREFGGTKSGGREKEPLFYIAEIMSRFDMVAVQEVRDNLDRCDYIVTSLELKGSLSAGVLSTQIRDTAISEELLYPDQRAAGGARRRTGRFPGAVHVGGFSRRK